VFLAKHYIFESFTPNTPGSVLLLICFFLYLLYILFAGPVSYLMGYLFKSYMIDAMEINEDIDTYTNCLDENDRRWTIQEELNMKDCYNISTKQDEIIEDIKNGWMKRSDMHLQGVHTYDILRNPSYIKAFSYFSADDKYRESVIIDGDNDSNNNAV
jgi:hypothetical protein